MGADSKSWFLLPKTKGQVEEAIRVLGYPNYTIHRPGMLFNRENDKRLIEKILSWMPLPGIESADVGKAILWHAIQTLLHNDQVP
jgi:hypothetical protein